MVNAGLYTPLESYYLFTWIQNHGLEAFQAAAFLRLSTELVNHKLVNNDPSFDAARLNPDSLQELFLQLLQEELKDEPKNHTENHDAEGSLSPNSKKRKRPGSAPQLSTLGDAREHIDILPRATDKLRDTYYADLTRVANEAQEEWRREQRELEREEQLLKELDEREAQKQDENQNGNSVSSTVENHTQQGSVARVMDAPPKDPGVPNGTHPSPSLPLPQPGEAQKSPVPPVLQPSPARPVSVPASQPQIQPPVSQPGHFGQIVPPIRAPEPPRLSNGASPVLQPPQGAPSFSPRPGSAALSPPTSDILKRPDSASKGNSPAPSQPTQVPVPGTLKWETPYQPPSNPSQQRPPQEAGQYASQKGPLPQQWGPQPPLQYPSPQPLQPHPQGQGQLVSQPQRPVLVAPQPAGQGPLHIQPVPIRPQPASSGAPPQQQPSAGPSIPGHARAPHPSFPGQQGFPQPQPPPLQIRTNTGRNLPPISPATPQPQPQQWQNPPTPAQVPLQVQRPLPAPHPAPSGSNVQYGLPPNNQGPRPPIPQHVVSSQAMTPGPSPRSRPMQIALPQTPITAPAVSSGPTGSSTRWKFAVSTPATPRPLAGDIASPVVETLSPPLPRAELPAPTPKRLPKKPVDPVDTDTTAVKKGARTPRSTQQASEAGDLRRSRRSMSASTPVDESMDTGSATKVKREEATPKPLEDTGDTTADESVSGRRLKTSSPRSSRAIGKRKRQDSPIRDSPSAIPTHVLWYRSFHRTSASALDQISSNRDANMFASAIREKDAPSYKHIVLRPTDLKAIRAAIIAGNRAGAKAAAALPGGDPGAGSVWLPITEDLVPPRGIINSAHLERELVHMFANAIMYNPDPSKGLGPGFMRGNDRGGGATDAHGSSQGGGDPYSMVGYQVDENSIVKQSQAMFVEVEKLLSDLRSTEAPSGNPPAPLPAGAVPASERLARGAAAAMAKEQTPRASASVAPATEDEADDGSTADAEGSTGTAKRRRRG